MAEVLSRAPVYFVAAQVRHNPIAGITDEAQRARLKEIFRKLGYPDQTDAEALIRVEVAGETFEVRAPPHVLCMTASKTRAVAIHADRYWMQTTAYHDFEEFSSHFMEALEALHEELKLDYVESLSMRFLDAIVPDEGETLAQYLPPGLLGLDEWARERGWSMDRQATEHIFHAGPHRIMFRSIQRDGRIGLPPDLAAMGMPLPEHHRQVECKHVVLDTDALLEERREINLQMLSEHLVSLKHELTQCFRTVVTRHALERWK